MPVNLHPGASRIDAVIGNEHAKRAFEVALAGGHCLAIVGGNNVEADKLQAAAKAYGLVACRLKTCRCGNFGSPVVACTCCLSAVRRFRNTRHWQAGLDVDITIEVAWMIRAESVKAYAAGLRGESDEAVLDRLAVLPETPVDLALDETGQALLAAYVKRFPQANVDRAVKVAGTIARLAHSQRIQTAHLAESLQYQILPDYLNL